MQLILAEKPSVGREIAYHVGAQEKKDGYLEGNNYCVSWAFGHLVTLAMPEDYGIVGFQKSALPIIPNPFTLTVKKIKQGTTYIPDAGATKQLQVIKKLMHACESIIVATDAGREGELIFRYIYAYLNCQKPFERLWISSLTEKAICHGLDNLRAGKEFDGLFEAAQSRSRADWLIGINASQALSIAAGTGNYSLGRVQTPTLALICERYIAHQAFVTKNYYEIELLHSKEFLHFKSLSQKRWEDKSTAEDCLKVILRNGSDALITAVEIKEQNEQAPLLFDLTGLQKEANKKLSFTAEETLQIAQDLYEKKFISYPRTGSKYIPNDIWSEIPNLVQALQVKTSCKEAALKIKWERFNKRIVNDLRVTDHHGILITEKIPTALSVNENAIYDMIAFRLLEALSSPCIKEISEITLEASHFEFKLRGTKILSGGWRSIKGNFGSKKDEIIQETPALSIGSTLKIKEAKVLEKKTKAPSLYSEASLLSSMENAGKVINNKEARKAIQQIGIGTAATRAAIIETLLQRAYIRREKKSLIPTEKGLKVYELVKTHQIADVGMTASWELALQKIENREMNATEFQQEMELFTIAITKELLQSTIQIEKTPHWVCPKCKTTILLIRDKFIKCPTEACAWIQFRNVCDQQIGIPDLEKLITQGRSGLIKGMKSKSGKSFSAYIVLNNLAESSFEFEERKAKKKG